LITQCSELDVSNLIRARSFNGIGKGVESIVESKTRSLNPAATREAREPVLPEPESPSKSNFVNSEDWCLSRLGIVRLSFKVRASVAGVGDFVTVKRHAVLAGAEERGGALPSGAGLATVRGPFEPRGEGHRGTNGFHGRRSKSLSRNRSRTSGDFEQILRKVQPPYIPQLRSFIGQWFSLREAFRLGRPEAEVGEPLFELGFGAVGEAALKTRKTNRDLCCIDDNTGNGCAKLYARCKSIDRHLIVWGEAVEIMRSRTAARCFSVHDILLSSEFNDAVEVAAKKVRLVSLQANARSRFPSCIRPPLHFHPKAQLHRGLAIRKDQGRRRVVAELVEIPDD
jgi:hypothetical protein